MVLAFSNLLRLLSPLFHLQTADPSPPTCRNKHALVSWNTPHSGHRCDLCRVKLDSGAKVHRCHECDWDGCLACIPSLKGRVGEEEENAYLVPPDDDERQWREDFEQNVWPRVLAVRDEKAVAEELCFRHKTLYTSEATLQCLEAHTSPLRAIFAAARRSSADSRRGGAGRSHDDRATGMSLEAWTDLLQRSEVVAGPAASAPGSDRKEEEGGGKESADGDRDSKSDGKESEDDRSRRRSVVLHSAEGEFVRHHSKVNLNAHVCDSFAAAKTPGDSKWKRALAKSAGAKARVLFSVTDARRWFVFSLMLRSADVGAAEKTAKKATTMSFLDFSEALCRVAHARPGPDEEELRDLIGELHEGVGDGTS